MSAASIRPESYQRVGWKIKGHEAEMMTMIAGGASVNEIAFYFQCSTDAVYYQMRKCGHQPDTAARTAWRRGTTSLSAEAQAKCRAWHAQGWGARRMASHLVALGLAVAPASGMLKVIMRWRRTEGLPDNRLAARQPRVGRGQGEAVSLADFEARIAAAEAKESARIARLARRCDCGGIVSPGIAHNCRRMA